MINLINNFIYFTKNIFTELYRMENYIKLMHDIKVKLGGEESLEKITVLNIINKLFYSCENLYF